MLSLGPENLPVLQFAHGRVPSFCVQKPGLSIAPGANRPSRAENKPAPTVLSIVYCHVTCKQEPISQSEPKQYAKLRAWLSHQVKQHAFLQQSLLPVMAM